MENVLGICTSKQHSVYKSRVYFFGKLPLLQVRIKQSLNNLKKTTKFSQIPFLIQTDCIGICTFGSIVNKNVFVKKQYSHVLTKSDEIRHRTFVG